MTAYVPAHISISTDPSSNALLTEECSSAIDGRMIVLKTANDNGAGGFVSGMGTVDYATGALSIKVVDFDRSTESYKSDHDFPTDFAVSIAGGGTSGGTGLKGGTYSTTSMGEEVLAGSSIVARYRVGASLPRPHAQSYTPGAVTIDLCPYTSHSIVAGSIQFRWMGHVYEDADGVIYRGRTGSSPGTASGTVNYAAGVAVMTDWVVGGPGPADFQLLSLWTRAGQWTTACLFFSTEAAPLRAGAGGFVLTVLDTKGETLVANVDAQGNITGDHMLGKIDFSRGGCELQFGDYVLDADLSAVDKAEWWYDAADVGAVHPGKVWRPWPVDPATLRYSAVSYIYLPVDVALMGIDPAALPADGRVVHVRPGGTCVVGITHGGTAFTPAVGMTYNLGHERLSFAQVMDASTGAEVLTGYTADLDAGMVTFTDLAGYPAQVKVLGRTEVYRQIAEVRIDGKVRLTQPIGYGFPAGAVLSTALRQGDRFARVSRVYDQASWNGTTWYDGVDPLAGQAIATYNIGQYPVEVNNRGAITERWALRMRSDNTTVDLIGQHLGQIASGTINADFSPMNVAAGVPYMTVRAAGWNAGWVAGNVLFIDTVGAEAPVAVVRATQPGSPAGLDDSFWIVQRGDVARDPGSSFD